MTSIRRIRSCNEGAFSQRETVGCEHRSRPVSGQADGPEIGALQPPHRGKIQPLLAPLGDPSRPVNSLSVSIRHKRHHDARRVGRTAPRLLAISRYHRRQVDFAAHQVTDQVRTMSGRHKILDRRRQQPYVINTTGETSYSYQISHHHRAFPSAPDDSDGLPARYSSRNAEDRLFPSRHFSTSRAAPRPHRATRMAEIFVTPAGSGRAACDRR